MAQEKEPLYATIVDAAPELDFLFAFARRKQVSITISIEGVERKMDGYIDSLSVGPGERIHPPSWEFTNTWFIEGHFWGNGKDCWSQIFERSKGIQEDGWGGHEEHIEIIDVWGGFQGVYNKGKRKGQISTINYKRMTVSRKICPCQKLPN